MQELATACPLDCPDTCTLKVSIDNGEVVKLDGSAKNPITSEFICGKVRKFTRHMYGPQRLRHPMVRTGPKGSRQFERISWDEAFTQLCAKIDQVRDQHGGESILPFNYGGCNGYLTDGTVDHRLFRRLGASRLMYTYCAVPVGEALRGLYGNLPGVPFEDYQHARLIVLWGINPSATNIHLVPFINQAREQGARLVVVDPRAIPLARQADLHIPLRPGTDGPVALSIINWLFTSGRADQAFLEQHGRGWQTLRERAAPWTFEATAKVAGLNIADLQKLAAWYADAEPALIRVGNGLERNRNGGSSAAAVMALPAVAGKFGVRAGGFTAFNGGGWPHSLEPAINEPEPDTRLLNMTQLARALGNLSDPPIKLLFVYNCNPMATAPRQAHLRTQLLRDDIYTVVYEQVHTDTCDYADLILPATTFLEHRELRKSYGTRRMFDSPAVIPPVGEARPNYEVFAELCRRLDMHRPDDPETPQELVDAILGTIPDGDGVRADLAKSGMASRPVLTGTVQFGDVWPTTDGQKIEFIPADLERQAPMGLYGFQPDPGTEEHPLALISPALARQVSSSFGQLTSDRVPLDMNPADAAARSLESGARVRVFNDLGSFICTVRVTDQVCPGVVSLPKGLWLHHTEDGGTSNAVIPDSEADVGGAACFNDARVQIERA